MADRPPIPKNVVPAGPPVGGPGLRPGPGAGPVPGSGPGGKQSFLRDLGGIWALRRYFWKFAPMALVVMGLAYLQAACTATGISCISAVLNQIGSNALTRESLFRPLGADLAAPKVVSGEQGLAGILRWYRAFTSPNSPPKALIIAILFFLTLGVLLKLFREYLRRDVNLRLKTGLREDVVLALAHEPAESRIKRSEGETAELFREDVDRVAMLLVFGVLSSFESLFLAVFYSFKLAEVPQGRGGGWLILATVLALNVFSAMMFATLFRPAVSKAAGASEMMREQAVAGTTRFFLLFRELLAFGSEEKIGRKIVGIWREVGKRNDRFALLTGIQNNLNELIRQLSIPIVIIVALVFSRSVDVGEITAIQLFLGQITTPIMEVIGFPSLLLAARHSIFKVGHLFENRSKEDAPADLGKLLASEHAPEVRLEGIGFAYPTSQGNEIIKDISFTVPAGMRIGIVGGSGCGKSTLARLILGEYKPTRGRILIDGVDVTSWAVRWRRQVIGYLTDTPGFLIDTLRNNIFFGRDCSDAKFNSAADMSDAASVAAKKGKGWEEIIPPNADEFLSAGERKRVGLARILVGSYRVYVLDEPLANLNPDLARDIAVRIRKATSGITTVVITHEPDLIQTDFNVFLDNGRVLATGKHSELLLTCPEYLARYGASAPNEV